jgi:putative transposase
VKTLYITAAEPWENRYNESFNGSLRDELLDGQISYRLAEAKVLIEAWRRHCNTIRPHSSLGYRPPAPETATPPLPPSGSVSLRLQPKMAKLERHALIFDSDYSMGADQRKPCGVMSPGTPRMTGDVSAIRMDG